MRVRIAAAYEPHATPPDRRRRPLKHDALDPDRDRLAIHQTSKHTRALIARR